MSHTNRTREAIHELVTSTGARTPAEAVRLKARALLAQFSEIFGEPTMPLNLDALTSFVGIVRSDEPPLHSEDAELVPIAGGRVAIRVNPDRPETRRRFSVAHEICHTFFRHYQTKTWCRTDSRFRRRDNADEHLEMLCDIGASEIVMPLPWFESDARSVMSAASLEELASKYNTSREATLRRFVEISDRPLTAVYFSWRHKPSERRKHTPNQAKLPGFPDDIFPPKKLRLEYSISSRAGDSNAGEYLPRHKSVDLDGPLFGAAVGVPSDGECHLDLGPAAGKYRVMAVPVWTPEEQLGPNGENGVAAIIEPIAQKAVSVRGDLIGLC